MEESTWTKFGEMIDRNFALKLVDKMIEWDRYIIDQRHKGREVSESDFQTLHDIYDYFFFMVLKCELKDIDNIFRMLLDLRHRVVEKHKNLFYDGFFEAVGQILLFRKLLALGDEVWFLDWKQSFRRSLSKLGL